MFIKMDTHSLILTMTVMFKGSSDWLTSGWQQRISAVLSGEMERFADKAWDSAAVSVYDITCNIFRFALPKCLCLIGASS